MLKAVTLAPRGPVMQAIGAPLRRDLWLSLLDGARSGFRLLAPPVIAAALLFGAWELASRNGLVSRRLYQTAADMPGRASAAAAEAQTSVDAYRKARSG